MTHRPKGLNFENYTYKNKFDMLKVLSRTIIVVLYKGMIKIT